MARSSCGAPTTLAAAGAVVRARGASRTRRSSSNSAARASATSKSRSTTSSRTRHGSPRRTASPTICTSRRTTGRCSSNCCSTPAILYNRRMLDETARLLRAQRYLNEATCRAGPLQRGRQHRRRAGARARRVDAEPRPLVRPQGRRKQHAREVRGHELSRARQGAVARTLQRRRSHGLGARLRRPERLRQLVEAVGGLLVAERRQREGAVALERPFYAWIRAGARTLRRRHRPPFVSRYSLGHAGRAAADAGTPVRDRRRLLRRTARRLDHALPRRHSATTPANSPALATTATGVHPRRPRRRLSMDRLRSHRRRVRAAHAISIRSAAPKICTSA